MLQHDLSSFVKAPAENVPTDAPKTTDTATRSPPRKERYVKLDWSKVDGDRYKDINDLPEELEPHAKISLVFEGSITELAGRLEAIGHRNGMPPYEGGYSDIGQAVATACVKAGMTNEEIASVLVSQHFYGNKHTRKKTGSDQQRAIKRMIFEAEKETKTKPAALAVPPCGPLTLKPIWPTGFSPADIAKRDWLVRGVLMNKQVTVLYGQGGTAKSLLTLGIANACALGIEWNGFRPVKAVKVLVLNAEDDVEEQRRRTAALLNKLGIADRERQLLNDRLFTFELSNYFLVQRGGDGKLTNTELLTQLKKSCIENGIGLLTLDPLVSLTFGLDENSAEMQMLCETVRELARDLNIPVLLIHHTSKSGVGGDQNAGRGSSVISAAARTVLTVEVMSEQDALFRKVPLKDRFHYVCVKVAKANHGARGMQWWFKLVTVVLPSDEEVATLIPAVFTSKSVLDEDWLGDFLAKIEAGRDGGNRYVSSGPKSARADQLLVDEFDVAPQAAKAAVGELIAEGRLEAREYRKSGNDRRLSTGLFVVPYQPEGAPNDLPF